MTRDHPLLPFLVSAAAVASFSLMDALMKGASIAIGAYSALLYRCLIGTVLVLPLWRLERGRPLTSEALRIHALRGAVGCGMALLFFYGLVRLPIAEAIALSFVAPLLALYLAAIMLGERIERKTIAASVLASFGIFVITIGRLENGMLDERALRGIVAVLGSAALYAWNLVLQRRISQIAPPCEIALAHNGFSSLILLCFAPLMAATPSVADLGWIAIAACLATVSLIMLAWAYARAEAQALVPVEYTAFLWAGLFGWLFFSERVQPATLAGALLIVVGCWIAAPRRRTEQTAL